MSQWLLTQLLHLR